MTRENAIQKIIDELMINNVVLIFNPHIFGTYLEQLYGMGVNEGLNLQHHKTFTNRPKVFEIEQYDMDGNFKQSFLTSVFAERATGIKHQNIINVCKGKKKSAGGYIWKFKM